MQGPALILLATTSETEQYDEALESYYHILSQNPRHYDASMSVGENSTKARDDSIVVLTTC